MRSQDPAECDRCYDRCYVCIARILLSVTGVVTGVCALPGSC